MLRTLHGKLALALLALLSLVGTLFVLSTIHTSRRYQQEVRQKVNLDLAARLVSESDLMLDTQVADEQLTTVVDALAVTNPGVELYVLAPDGRVLGASADIEALELSGVDIRPIERFLSGDLDSLILGSNPRSPEMPAPFSAARIPADGALQGYLYIILADEAQESVAAMVQDSYVLRLSVASGLSALLLVFITGYLAFRFLTRRLRRLSTEMTSFRSAERHGGVDHDATTNSPTRDEVAQLEAAFTDLVRRVSEQMNDLRQADRLRRELLTNVSHDLRTPLAAMRGYLETLQMKSGLLTQVESASYLDAAAKHGERLESLITELFELARLDSGEAPAKPEPFPLTELIQDVSQKYQLAARNKHVELRTEYSTALPFVIADIGLIERVFSNLIDNAIRYTPTGGAVTLGLRPSNGSVVVEVTDTGSGITEADLPHIFDRFYRVDSHDSTTSQGAGLGLAIAKRVLELHGRDIEAISNPAGGTTFRFSLPAQEAVR